MNKTDTGMDESLGYSKTNKEELDNSFLYIKKGPCKIPLPYKESGWYVTVEGKKYHLSPGDERAWVYWIYSTNDLQKINDRLDSLTKRTLSSRQVDLIINNFKVNHKPVRIESYLFEQIPFYADVKRGLEIRVLSKRYVLTCSQERKIMEMIKKNPTREVYDEIRKWFQTYIEKKDINLLYSEEDEVDMLFADAFLLQHGMGYADFLKIEKTVMPEKIKNNYFREDFWMGFRHSLYVSGYIGLCFGLIVWGYYAQSFGGLLTILGLAGLVGPFYIVSLRKPRSLQLLG